jgi:hypothetical protein
MLVITLLASTCLLPVKVAGQPYFQETAPGKYRVVLTDKDNNPFSLDRPDEFLSARALYRRQKQGVALSFNDLPVTPAYLDSIRKAGAEILTVSKWLNAVTIKSDQDSILERIAVLPFVRTDFPKTSIALKAAPSPRISKFDESYYNPVTDYGVALAQISMHNGQLLHERGFTGEGVQIALLDAGFYRANELPVFARLRDNGQILGTRDFVDRSSDIYQEYSHGTVVMSIIGGYLPGEFTGTAPDADFWLLRSEDVHSEYIIEEDNWIAAAEYADSLGADIINTSLGYSWFDAPEQDHAYADMDGNTTRVSLGADIAASKGMLVVVSAGNQGGSYWGYITAPSDADSVLAVGAVNANGVIASFSGRGPSSDGRVKPDVVATGEGTFVSDYSGTIRQGNGTSLSAPIITGLAACLWQAVPEASAMDVLRAIKSSADRFMDPDTSYGYGIPDFNLACVLLKAMQPDTGKSWQFLTFPNPFRNELYVLFDEPLDENITVTLVHEDGSIVWQGVYPANVNRIYLKFGDEFSNLSKGVYLLKIYSSKYTGYSKLIKY